MKKTVVLSVNIGEKREIQFQSKIIETGIFKFPINTSIYLAKKEVTFDNVVDRKHHGGSEKAVYAYCKNHYSYFQELYPKLKFHNGIFGENLTVTNLFETEVYIGDIFKIGDAIIQVSQPRYPCYKLGIVFGNQKIIKQFLNTNFTGFYFRILQEGFVNKNDELKLLKKATNSLTLSQVFSIFTKNKKNKVLIEKALSLEFLSNETKVRLNKLLKWKKQ